MKNGHMARASALGAIGLLGLLPTTAQSDPVTIVNSSFELPVTPPDSFLVGPAPDGWTAYGSVNLVDRVVGVLNPNTTALYLDPVPDGSNVAVTFLSNFSGNEAGLEQTLAATLQPLTQYTLNVEVGNLATYEVPPHDPFDFDGFPGYRIELLAGGVVVASDEDTLLPGEGRFLTSTVQLAVGLDHAQLGQPLGIRLVNLDAAPGVEVNFDDVRLDATALECPPLPVAGCKVAVPARGELSFAVAAGVPAKSAAGWAWKGEETTPAELGSPLTTTSYLFCVYDGGDEVVLRLRATAGGSCAGKDCWKASASGFRYRDKAGSLGGLTDLQLKAGADGKASIKMKARGAALEAPTLPLVQDPAPVRAILQNEESGDCWEASYSTTPGDPASTSKWKARND